MKKTFKFLFNIFLISGSLFSQSVPNSQELSLNVRDELIDIVSSVFQTGKQEYGFQSTDDIGQIVIGKPFKLYMIPEKHLSQLQVCANVNDMIEKDLLNFQMYSILYIGSRPVCLVSYYNGPDGYHLGGISTTLFIDDLNTITINYQNPIILSSYLKQDIYFSSEVDNYLQMHPLAGVKSLGLNKALEKSKSIFTFMNEIETISNSGENK